MVDSKCVTTLYLQTTDSLDSVPSVHYGSCPRRNCGVCDENHNADDCHIRGTVFMSLSLARKVTRYNELHDNTPKFPKKDKLQVPFHPRHRQPKPSANIFSVSVPVDDKPPIQPSADDTGNISNSSIVQLILLMKKMFCPLLQSMIIQVQELDLPLASQNTRMFLKIT